MNAPDCVQGKDGRYYLYYQLHLLTCTSVAVADTPAGPFTFYGDVQHSDGKAWGTKKGDTFVFDPGVLVDDDGKSYLYGGFSATGILQTVMKLRGNRLDGAVCLHLADDMKTVEGGEHLIAPGPKLAKGTPFEGHAFFEASSPRKINGRYYFVYSSILSHELCYATSSCPDRDFRYGGTLVSIADVGYQGNKTPLNYTGNTHGGMVELNGQWYIFYHRQTNRVKCARQGCAEPITILPDGSIPQVEVTSCGLNGGPLASKGTYEARIACNLSGKDGVCKSDDAKKLDKKGLLPYFTQSGEDREKNGDQYIANLRDGAWCGFKYFAFDGSETKLTVTVRGTGEGALCFGTDREHLNAAKVHVSPAADWTSFDAPISLPKGVHALYVSFSGSGALDFYNFTIE